MNPETWQLESEPLSWKLEPFKIEPLETLNLGQVETLPHEPLETFSALGSTLRSVGEIESETLPK